MISPILGFRLGPLPFVELDEVPRPTLDFGLGPESSRARCRIAALFSAHNIINYLFVIFTQNTEVEIPIESTEGENTTLASSSVLNFSVSLFIFKTCLILPFRNPIPSLKRNWKLRKRSGLRGSEVEFSSSARSSASPKATSLLGTKSTGKTLSQLGANLSSDLLESRFGNFYPSSFRSTRGRLSASLSILRRSRTSMSSESSFSRLERS
jgi:hypothetical protein